MRYLRSLTLVSLAVVCLLAAGCGGGGDETANEPPPEPKPSAATLKQRAAYIAAADAICKRSNQRISAINRELRRLRVKYDYIKKSARLIPKIAPTLKKGVRVMEDGLAEFDSLDAPAADKEAIEVIAELGQDQIDMYSDIANSAESGDNQFFQATSYRLEKLIKQRSALMQDYGFKVCGANRS